MSNDDHLSESIKYIHRIISSSNIIESFYGKVKYKKIGKNELAFIKSISEQMIDIKNKTLEAKEDYENRKIIDKDAMNKILMIFPQ